MNENTLHNLRIRPITTSSHKLLIVALTVVFSLLISCSEVSPRFEINDSTNDSSSGSSTGVGRESSNAGFISYFIEPLSEPIISVYKDSKNADQTLPYTKITTQKQFLAITNQADTVKSSISPEYCKFYATDFSNKTATKRLHKEPSSHLAINSPLIAERSYLELMRHFCYNNEALSLKGSDVTDDSNDKYGKVHWYRNPSASIGSGKSFDFLISQSNKDDKYKILSVFQGALTEETKPGNERIYGKLQLSQGPKPEKVRESKLIRYFVDDVSKNQPIPNRFRQENYAISTKADGTDNIHNIATFIIDYVSNSTGSDDEPNGLIIHSSQFTVHSKWGAKLVKASYCVYENISLSGAKSVLSADKDTYTCDNDKANEVKELSYSSYIDNKDRTGDSVTSGYYSNAGFLLKQQQGNSYSEEDKEIIKKIEAYTDKDALDKLSAKNSLPLNAGKEISSDTLNTIFDTKSKYSYLKFDQ